MDWRGKERRDGWMDRTVIISNGRSEEQEEEAAAGCKHDTYTL